MSRPLLVLLCCLGSISCSGTESGTTAPPPDVVPPTMASAVDVQDNHFAPPSISTTTTQAVTWTWRGAADHNVTFEDGQGSSTTKSSGSHQRTFASAGTYRYRCTLHSSNFISGMVGVVVVP